MNGTDSRLRRAEQRLTIASRHPAARKAAALHHATKGVTRLGSSSRQYLPSLFVCAQTPIAGLMSRDVFCVAPDVSVEGLTALLLERGLNAVPVVDAVGRIVGVVSTADLLREVQDRGDDEERLPLGAFDAQGIQLALGDGFHATALARATAAEVMMPSTLAVHETASVAEAAALMTLEGVGELPVVGAGYRIIGTITARDVMRWLAEESGFLTPPTAGPKGAEHAAIATRETSLGVIGTIDAALATETANDVDRSSIAARGAR